MDVGVGLWTMQSTAADPRNHTLLYENLREDARMVEDLGFASMWLGEHRFWYDGWCPSLLTAAASAAAVTTRLRFGTAMLLLPQHDASHLAAAASALDWTSEGRLELGVGLGYRDAEFDGLGLRRRDRGERMTAGLGACGRAWAGEAVPSDHDAHPRPIWPTPRDGGPPLWIGGMAAPALERAVTHSASYLLPQTLYADEVASIVTRIEATAREGGALRGRIGMLKDCHITTHGGGEDFAAAYLRHFREEAGSWWLLGDGAHGFAAPGRLEEQMRRLERTVVVGTPGHVAEQLRDLQDRGVEYLVVRLHFDVTRPATRDQLVRFASEVLPRLDAR